MRDGLDRYDLVIDFSWPPEDIVAGLQQVFSDGVRSGRWSRSDHHRATDETEEAAPHPEDGLP